MMKVALNGIRIFARHGYFEEEAILGNDFEIDIAVNTSMTQEDSDDLSDTLDYGHLFEIVKSEMAIRSDLLEHVLFRIKANIISTFPHQVRGIYISIKKMNPPLGGDVTNSQISIEEDYGTQCARCGKGQSCFNSQDCWCKGIPLSDVTRDQLQRQYSGCLCDTCLQQFTSSPELVIEK